MKEYQELIDKVSEFRHSKVKQRQINKFNKVMQKERNITWQGSQGVHCSAPPIYRASSPQAVSTPPPAVRANFPQAGSGSPHAISSSTQAARSSSSQAGSPCPQAVNSPHQAGLSR